MINEIIELASIKDKVRILSTIENVNKYKNLKCIDIGNRNNLTEISYNIFSLRRKIDE